MAADRRRGAGADRAHGRGDADVAVHGARVNLRLVTINLWGTEPPLERRLALAIRQLTALAPDVIAIQECRPLDGVRGKTTADAIAEALGMTACYERSTAWADGAWAGATAGEEGLAIVSRHPIAAHRAIELPEAR